MKEVYGIIYKIENLVNGKIYIGQTTRSFNERYCAKGEGIERVYGYCKQRINSCETNYNHHLFSSIKKYGFENFKVDEVFDVAKSKEELNNKEIYWIKYYKSNDPKYGYNETRGGECGSVHNYRRCKIDYLLERVKPIFVLEFGGVFASKNEFIKSNDKHPKLKEERGLREIYKNNIYTYKDDYNYTKTEDNMYHIYCIKNPPYYGTFVPIINTCTNEIFFNSKLAKDKYGKNVIKKCKENSITKNIDDEWMYLIEFLAHKRAGDFNE